MKLLHKANIMDHSEAMRLTYAISSIVGRRFRVYYILAAKDLYQLVKELAFLFLSSGNKIPKLVIRDRNLCHKCMCKKKEAVAQIMWFETHLEYKTA